MQTYEEATVGFARIVDFTTIAGKLGPVQLVQLLNELFAKLDDIVNKHGVYKVESVNEQYMISCGCPVRTPHHAEFIADVALHWLALMASFKEQSTGMPIQIKIGKFFCIQVLKTQR